MSRENPRSRRRLLQLTGIAASTALVAGCGGPGDEADPDAEEGTGNGQDRDEDEVEDATTDDAGADESGVQDDDGEAGEDGGSGAGEDEEPGASEEDGGGGDGETENESGEDDERTDPEDVDDWGDVEEIHLDAEASGWIGRSPSLIVGEENPSLELSEGREYEFVYENLDGNDHNVAIYGEDEADIESTPIDDEEGVTRSLTVAATADMTEYLCEVHPDEMVGEIEIQE